MMTKYIFLLYLALFALNHVSAQNDELQVPDENDNIFPPDGILDKDLIEGSGSGTLVEPTDVTEAPIAAHIGIVDTEDNVTITPEETLPCPKPCLCNTEGNSEDFIVNCAGYGLTDFPSPIDPRTTTLNLNNNKLTEIPKEISSLKKLKVLNANQNSIMELSSGSVSELPELEVLELASNRLIEFPKDLKNGFGLLKLTTLDLGDNDMRTELTPDYFSNFQALQTLTLPTSTPELLDHLCASSSLNLNVVCTGSCKTDTHECSDTTDDNDNGLSDAVLSGSIAFQENVDPSIDISNHVNEDIGTEATTAAPLSRDNTTPTDTPIDDNNATPTVLVESTTVDDFSLRSAVDQASGGIAKFNNIVEAPKDVNGTETDVKVGATTSDTKTGGVDKSIIGMIVAGMVLVVAGITIKKNWSSIKNKFSSDSRTPDRRANGHAPEEVPLQNNDQNKDKSPV